MNDPHDEVKHPAHYCSHASGLECWEVNDCLPANLACVVKYVWRKDEKGAPLVDVKKALAYAERERRLANHDPVEWAHRVRSTAAWRCPELSGFLAKVRASELVLVPAGQALFGDVIGLLALFVDGYVTAGPFFDALVVALRGEVDRLENAK